VTGLFGYCCLHSLKCYLLSLDGCPSFGLQFVMREELEKQLGLRT